MIELLPSEDISEMDFGYNTRMEGYANLSSDMTELCEIDIKTKGGYV